MGHPMSPGAAAVATVAAQLHDLEPLPNQQARCRVCLKVLHVCGDRIHDAHAPWLDPCPGPKE